MGAPVRLVAWFGVAALGAIWMGVMIVRGGRWPVTAVPVPDVVREEPLGGPAATSSPPAVAPPAGPGAVPPALAGGVPHDHPDASMWRGRTLSVILPTYNEKDSIADTINRFAELGIVDDIVVINNNAAPGTSDEVATTPAREIVETRQGYGAAIRRGLVEVDTDLICVCEPDGTFDPADLLKLLPFTRECDFVVGSRTVSNFIWEGSNMGWFLQWGNWAMAKLIEALFNTSYLSDVGCTFRVVSRERVRDIVARARVDGSRSAWRC